MDKSIRYLKGVGEKRAKLLEKLDVFTVGDLVRLLPRRYEDLGNVVDISELAAHRGEKVSVVATVSAPVKETRIKGANTLTTVYAEDRSKNRRADTHQPRVLRGRGCARARNTACIPARKRAEPKAYAKNGHVGARGPFSYRAAARLGFRKIQALLTFGRTT